MADRFIRSLKKPRIILISFLHRTCKLYPDKLYLKLLFRLEMGYSLNLKHPQTFNEKLNWLKIFDRNPLYTKLADKYEAKKYVEAKIGSEYLVKNYGVWNDVDEIDFNNLPNQFVLKATGDSSGIVICKNKVDLDFVSVKAKLRRCQNSNYYYFLREWAYKEIKAKIIADEFLNDNSDHELQDYKFWCFNGEPKVMYCTNKAADIFENFYDLDFNVIYINHGFRRNVPEFKKPEAYVLMKELVTKLSKDIPFVRIDFFYVNDRIYFGEFTFYDWGGMRPFADRSWDIKLGSLLKLPEKK